MIQMPRRSVTRFFIPLIDVMTLLFCIFLLMPMFKEGAQADAGRLVPGDLATLQRRHEALERKWQDLSRRAAENEQELRELRGKQVDLAREQQELDRLRKERMKTLQQRLNIRVLDIDADTGRLYYYDPRLDNPRQEITGPEDARALIEAHREEAPGRELYYLFLFPRRVTGFPQVRQLKQYDRWFEGVAHGFENPGGKS